MPFKQHLQSIRKILWRSIRVPSPSLTIIKKFCADLPVPSDVEVNKSSEPDLPPVTTCVTPSKRRDARLVRPEPLTFLIILLPEGLSLPQAYSGFIFPPEIPADLSKVMKKYRLIYLFRWPSLRLGHNSNDLISYLTESRFSAPKFPLILYGKTPFDSFLEGFLETIGALDGVH